MSLGRALVRNLGSALWGKATVVGCGMLTFAILARQLGAEGLGEYRTVLTLLAFAGTALDLGLYHATLRRISEPGADQPRVMGNAFALRAAATALAVLLLAGLVHVSRFDHAILVGVLVAGVGWIAYQISELALGIYQQRLVQHQAAVAEILGAVTTLVAVLLLSRAGGGVTAMLGATAGGWIVAMSMSWLLATRLVPFVPRIDHAESKRLLLAGLPIAASGVLMIIHLRADVLLLATLGGFREVGMYDVSLKIYELLATVPVLFAGLLMPLLVADRGADASVPGRRLQAAIAVCVAVLAIVLPVVMVHAESIARLLAGAEFHASGQVMRILVVAVAFGAISQIIRFAAIAQDLQATMLKADVVAVVAAVVAYLLLIPGHGMIGAATGKLIGDVAILGVALLIVGERLEPRVLRAVPLALAAAAALTVLLRLSAALGVNWLLASAVCAVAVAAVLFTRPTVRREFAALTRSSAGQSPS